MQPVLIDQTTSFNEMVSDLRTQKAIGVDTESNSLFVYHEQVCLIQISTPLKDYLVDSLTIKDILKLGEIFQNNKIVKVFHAADYDLACLKRDYNFEFVNIFDTLVATRTLGKQKFGLADLIKEYFHVELDKKYQKANWGIRPLKFEMLLYASLDSHYLVALKDILRKELIVKKRLDLVLEECEYHAKHIAPLNNHEADMWRIKGIGQLNLKQLLALQSLHDYRESLAEKINKPPFKVFRNDVLLEIARHLPKSSQELKDLNILSSNQFNQFQKPLLDVVHKSTLSKITRKQKPPRPSDEFLARSELLANWRKQMGIDLGIPSDVILPKDVLHRIIVENPQEEQELSTILKSLPVRNKLFNQSLLKNLKGKTTT